MLKNNITFTSTAEPICETVSEAAAAATEILRYPNGLTVTRVREYYPEFDATYERHYLENTSADTMRVEDFIDADLLLPLAPMEKPTLREITSGCEMKVVRLEGMVSVKTYRLDDLRSALEYGMTDDWLVKDRSYTSNGGRSSNGVVPIFDINRGSRGYILMLGWTGAWQASFSAAEDAVQVRAGLAHNTFLLPPGEKLMTLSTLILPYENGQKKARNTFRRLIKAHFSTVGQPGRPDHAMASCELWGALPSEEMIRRIDIMKEKKIVFDYIWLDAAWYGQFTEYCPDPSNHAWSRYVGEWTPNRNFHPDDLLDVVQHVEDAGMQFELWVEPERCANDLPAVQAHPDWFTSLDRYSLLDYGNPDAWQYAFDTLCRLIDTLHMGCYRQDFNTEPSNFWEKDRTPEEAALMELRHINGLYRLWDALLEKYPHLIIDNCAGGGRRFDLESVKRTVPFFRSDYQCSFNPDPDVTQCHNNLSEYLPYNGCTSKVKCDTYAVRSTFSSAWGGAFWNTGFQSLEGEELDWAAAITQEYRMLQPYFSCDYYSLASKGYDKSSWVVWQYDRPEENDGLILAFRRAESTCVSMTFSLETAKPGMLYTITDKDSGESWQVTSDAFASLSLTIPEKRMSRVLLYTAEAADA